MNEGAQRPRFLTDENFNRPIVAGLLRVRPEMDILTIQTAGIFQAPDPQVLLYASEHQRILLSHDLRTMPQHFADFYTGQAVERSSGTALA